MMIDYPFTVRKLSSDEGTGYLAEALDLNGCIADGETVEEAIHNLEDAIASWIKIEGVSLNTLTVSLLAERVGTRLSTLENAKHSAIAHQI